jgi:hypothetical protein
MHHCDSQERRVSLHPRSLAGMRPQECALLLQMWREEDSHYPLRERRIPNIAKMNPLNHFLSLFQVSHTQLFATLRIQRWIPCTMDHLQNPPDHVLASLPQPVNHKSGCPLLGRVRAVGELALGVETG